MNTMKSEKMYVIDALYRQLCKWDVRVACNDNPIAALIFLLFLKFVSDNRLRLKLDSQDIINFNNLLSSISQNNKTNEIILDYIQSIEMDIGYTNGILSTYAQNLDLLNHDEKLKPFIYEVNRLDLTMVNDTDFSVRDAIVDFIMLQSKKEIRFAVESITELSLAKLMSNIFQLEDEMSVYDFAAGYSISLTESTKGKNALIYAQDINAICSAVTVMMLILSMNTRIFIYCNDSLTNPCTLPRKDSKQQSNKQFDRVISAPSLGMPACVRNYNATAFEFLLDDIGKTDLFFAQHLLASLNENGKGILLMPLSALNRSGREARLRREMLERNYIDAIIELPIGIVPPTLVKTAIVVFDKSRTNDEIFFMGLETIAAKDYVERSGRTGARITDVGLQEISDIINTKKSVDGLSKMVTRDEVFRNDAKLSVGTYISSLPSEADFEVPDIISLKNKNKEMITKLSELNDEFENIIGLLTRKF